MPVKKFINRLSFDDLINAESALGRTIFGEIPLGHQREFFTAKRNVWIWHENWVNSLGETQEITIRYEVRPTGVFKKCNGGDYSKLEGDELKNFKNAAATYLRLVKENLYGVA